MNPPYDLCKTSATIVPCISMVLKSIFHHEGHTKKTLNKTPL